MYGTFPCFALEPASAVPVEALLQTIRRSSTPRQIFVSPLRAYLQIYSRVASRECVPPHQRRDVDEEVSIPFSVRSNL